MIGAGVIADGVAILEGLRAKQKGDQLSNDSRAGGVTFDPSVESAGKTANIAAIVLGIGGTALAITGTIILISSGHGGESTTGAESATTAMVTLTPWIGGGVVGGGARLVF
jgi:hypothetical protein